MLKWMLSALALPLAFGGPASAACPTFPYSFTNGSTADASQVNANFTNVANCFAPLANPSFTGLVSLGTTTGGWAPPSALSVATAIGWAGSFQGASGSTGALLLRMDSGPGQYEVAMYYGGSIMVGSISTNGSSVSFNSASDYRLKTNVEPLTGGLGRLMRLQPKRFNWKSAPTGAKTDGFLAHEVQDVAPYAVTGKKDAVNKDGSIAPQQMDYSKLVPLLVAAIKDQQAEIEQLKAQVAAFKTSR